PPDSRSSVSAILATIAGGRYGTPRTRLPMAIRVVAAATCVSSVHVSYVGLVPDGWSDEVRKSKPSASAWRASAAGARPGTADRQARHRGILAAADLHR